MNASATLHTSKAYQALALRGKVADLRIEDSQNLRTQITVTSRCFGCLRSRTLERRNGINGDPAAGRRPFMPASRILEGRLPKQHPALTNFLTANDDPQRGQSGISRAKTLAS